MSKLKAIVIDDEIRGLSNLAYNLREYCENEIELVAKTQNPVEGIKLIERLNPDILFLDIQMPKLDGFQVLERLNKYGFFLVFTTAHTKYGVRAIKASAFDYLLKPLDPVELKATVTRICKARESQNALNIETNQQAIELLHKNIKTENYPKQIMVPYQDHLKMVSVDEIRYLEADVNYTLINMINGTEYFVSKTLKSFGDLLDEEQFLRIHKSYLVNRNQIKETVKKTNYFLVLDNGKELPIARRRVKPILDKLLLS